MAVVVGGGEPNKTTSKESDPYKSNVADAALQENEARKP